MRNLFLIYAALLIIGILGRVIPHPPNFTPIGGILVFGMLKLEQKLFKYFFLLFVFWVSDLIVNNVIIPITFPQYYSGFQLFGNWSVYMALIFIMIGLKILINNWSKYLIASAGILHSTLFFLITNFGVWLESSLYPPTLNGFFICLGAGLPFFGNTLISTLIYSLVLLKGYHFVSKGFSIKNYTG